MKQCIYVQKQNQDHPEDWKNSYQAISPGLSEELLQSSRRYAICSFPDQQPSKSKPTRLSLLNTPEIGRLLCHSTFLRDADQEPGIISHMILDLPDTMDAHQIIQTWGSKHWQVSDNTASETLTDMLYLPTADVLNDDKMKEFLSEPSHCELFKFLVTAYLTTPERTTIVIAAPTEALALCIYGLTRIIPIGLLDHLSFSTYENMPWQCQARIVGTLKSVEESDFPSNMKDSIVYFDTTTNQHSPLTELAFSQFAVDVFLDNKTNQLQQFTDTWQRLGLDDTQLLDLIYRIDAGQGDISKDETQKLFQYPVPTAWITNYEQRVHSVLNWAIEDHHYAQTTFARLVQALKQKPDRLMELGQSIQRVALEAIKEGDISCTQNALDLLLPMVAPSQLDAIWKQIFTDITDLPQLSWDIRAYLLKKIPALFPLPAKQLPESTMQAWFYIPLESLQDFLQLDLPVPYLKIAVLQWLEPTDVCNSTIAQSLYRELCKYPHLILTVMQDLSVREPDGHSQAIQFFGSILDEELQYPWLDDLLSTHYQLPPEVLSSCVQACLDKQEIDIVQLINQHGIRILETVLKYPCLGQMVDMLMDYPPAHWLHNLAVIDFLQSYLHQSEKDHPHYEKLEQLLALQNFLHSDVLEKKMLQKVAAILTTFNPRFQDDLLQTVFNHLATTLLKRGDQESVQNDVECILQVIGKIHPAGSVGLYRSFLDDFRTQKSFWKQSYLLSTMIELALTGTLLSDQNNTHINLETEAFTLAHLARKHGGKKMFQEIHRLSEQWTPPTKTQWHFLTKAVQPRSVRSYLRDITIFLLAIPVVLLLQWLWKIIS